MEGVAVLHLVRAETLPLSLVLPPATPALHTEKGEHKRKTKNFRSRYHTGDHGVVLTVAGEVAWGSQHPCGHAGSPGAFFLPECLLSFCPRDGAPWGHLTPTFQQVPFLK